MLKTIEEKCFDKLPLEVQLNLLRNQCIIEQTICDLNRIERKSKL